MPDDIKSEPTANGDSLKIIDIITPWRTFVLSKRPTIRWNEVPGANDYLVSLMDGSETYWQQEVSGTEIVYPGNPPLKQGVSYSLAIKSNNDFSSESDLDRPEFKFKLLDPISAQKIEFRIEEIRKLELEPEVEALVLTTLYIEYGLNAKAIETLEKLIVDGNQNFVVYRTLAEIYQHIGLNVLSKALSKTILELESASDAMNTDLLEQKVIKVLELQSAINTSTERKRANLVEREINIEAMETASQQFVLCAVGQPCSTPTVPSGVWTYSARRGCYCSPVVGG